MHSLLTFLYNYRSSFLFILLEALSVFFIVNNNYYHQAAVLNSSNRLVASVMSTTNSVSEYFSLKEVNQRLAAENARLHELMISGEPNNVNSFMFKDSLALEALAEDSVFILPDIRSKSDSVRMKQFAFIPAKVVDNTVHRAKNYVTINKGRLDGIEPDMGVISPDGVVGKVKDVSDHFAVITSVLHTNMFVSALVKRSNTLGSIIWEGTNPNIAGLDNIPIHINIINGDTIVTSGYSGIYPPNTMIGTVAEVRPEEDAAFYDIDIQLSNDFYRLSYVYVVKNLLRNEQDSLENIITANE
ncbi:rod shape-determining protein MreC [Porifericola rhodea]|uniref:rod shape-determining protein MreC n=1 Tax=Porifericola rhodea TaxID=930972 RepID=UPI002666D89D|nr:rod shape-determining protein MreC [Porifericola rhodea]WKN33459.1 rod shape-determining protein MreC [Porifericola rhodea]